MTRWLQRLLLCFLALTGVVATAHEMSMAEMEMREIAPGEFTWQWTASGKFSASSELSPVWPDGCQSNSNVLRCGASGLAGKLSINGVGERYSAAVIKVRWFDGQSRTYTLTGGQPSVNLYGTADDQRGWSDIATAYTFLGFEHILGGYDHLLFVVGLLFLIGFDRRLVLTITAFTVAHSLTLASSALGLLTLRSPPVEAAIALSIMLVAGEALHQRPTLARRWPALVAFAFGLIHGLGFAGALKEIGLPENHVSIALLTFNIGVEIGQLAVVVLAWVVTRWLSRYPWHTLARAPALYVIGAMAAYWSWQRVVAITMSV